MTILLLQNMFSLSGNFAATIFGHLRQFIIASNTFSNWNSLSDKYNIYEKDWAIILSKNLYSRLFLRILEYCYKRAHSNLNLSFDNFLKKVNFIISKYVPLKKVSKRKLKFEKKLLNTPGIQKSISIKNKFLSKFITLKDSYQKIKLIINTRYT